jgi:peptidyl-tRNA hydrolase, PTH1 family
MKLIVGLGNPGRKYVGTRHNVGFVVLAEAARRWAGSGPQWNFEGEVVEAQRDGQKLLLLAPQTYMNASGRSVRKAIDFYKLNTEDLLVVCDDINLPLGKLRVRAKGSSGGQKGLEDIARHLGTTDFARLRIGIGEPPQGWDAAAYVLGKFTGEESQAIELAVASAVDALVDWAREGVQFCMNRYN